MIVAGSSGATITGSLEGRVAVVTGGAMGIGRAIVTRFAAEGASVVTADRAVDELQTLASELAAGGARVFALGGDVTVESDVDRIFDHATEHFGKLDILVNNVGASIEGSVEEATPHEWRWVLDTCVTSAYLCCRRAIPLLRAAGHGSIVNVASIQGQYGYPRFAAYA